MAGATRSSSKQTGARACSFVVCAPLVVSSFVHPLLCPPAAVLAPLLLCWPPAAVLASCYCAGPLLQVVGTIGPACQSVDVQVAMLEAGMSAAR